jgi:hypothetical protein
MAPDTGPRDPAEEEGVSGPQPESRWRTARSDCKDLVAPRTRADGRGLAFNTRRTTGLLWRRFGPGQGFDTSSDLRLDVVIPVAGIDTKVLPLTVAGLRRNLSHPLGRIVVVTEAGSEADRVATQLGCDVIDEDTVVPVRRSDLDYRVGPLDRSGWLFAQLLKLNVDTLSSEDHILLLDADTVLVRPQTFTRRGAVVALVSKEFHLPYFTAYEALLGEPPRSHLSFIAHQMVVNRRTLADLRAMIEHRRRRPWWQAILDACDFSLLSCFSEYELYGNYVLSHNRSMVRRWWGNCPAPRDNLSSLGDLQRRFGTRYRSVSFHHYI